MPDFIVASLCDSEKSAQIGDFMALLFSKRQNQASTIRSKISALNYYHKMWGGGELPVKHFHVKAVTQGITRRQGVSGANVRPVRRGLTWHQIEQGRALMSCRHLWADTPGGRVVWFGLALSYMWMLRASEIWADDATGALRPDYGLTRESVTFRKQGITLPLNRFAEAEVVVVHFKASKGDQKRIGADVARSGACAQVMIELFKLFPNLPATAPLMAYPHGETFSVLKRKEAVVVLRKMVSIVGEGLPSEYALHSGRVGGATAMMVAGRSDLEIMKAGRWKSAVFRTYIRLSPEMENASNALVPDK